MPAKLRHLSGQEVVSILKGFGFVPLTQRGSHVKLRRSGPKGEKQTLVVPIGGELDTGTLKAILRQASRYIPQEELRRRFYAE
ncbi:MAG: type II toxin-antitoxin system HicA family toxin [Candidatus Tectomicrobia bacterium]|nr:type II toxin-antitoxin system HicA family toxin [Candidatus Tectomicrobia bacterium]